MIVLRLLYHTWRRKANDSSEFLAAMSQKVVVEANVIHGNIFAINIFQHKAKVLGK